MIYEIRTYRIKPGSLAEVEKRYGEAYEHRKKYSQLAGFFHTEIGPLNEIIHIWPYTDLAERARVRAEAAKDPNWPPKIQEFITGMQVEVVVPFPFCPDVTPGSAGPIYEYRYYSVRAGTMPDIIKRWETKIAERTRLSPLWLAGAVEFGTANRYIHIWAYQSFEQRMQIRATAREKGVWPPPGGGDSIVLQDNKIVMPSKFSPAQ
jgi:hypothetical protein